MDKQDFLNSLELPSPPAGITVYLQSLLHRKEGDQWNAEYWYRRAGRNPAISSLSEEFDDLLEELL